MRLWGCMDEGIDSIWNYFFFLRMHACCLYESTWMVHETLDENKLYEICIYVWSPRWIHEWNLFFQYHKNVWKCIYLHKWMYLGIYEILFLIDIFFILYEWMYDPFLEKTICNVYVINVFFIFISKNYFFRKIKYVMHVGKNV